MKTRLLGAFVLVALLVLFVPMFFPSSPSKTAGDQSVSLAIPPAPDRDLQTRTMSLNPDAPAPAASAGAAPGSVVIPAKGSDGLATVDIASHRPTDVGTDAAAPSQQQASSDTSSTTPAPTEPVIKQQAAPRPAAPSPASEPAKAPPVAPGTAAHGNYTLNLSAYSSSTGAATLMQRVRALGYPVRSHAVHQGGKTLTAVEAGPFETRTAAESARLKITQTIHDVPARLESSAGNVASDDAPASRPSPGTTSKPAGHAKAGGWAVQVAAVSGQADANALRDKLRGAGFDGFVDSVKVGGKTLWRVRAGPQTQRSDAQRVRDQIKSRLGMAGNVVSVP